MGFELGSTVSKEASYVAAAYRWASAEETEDGSTSYKCVLCHDSLTCSDLCWMPMTDAGLFEKMKAFPSPALPHIPWLFRCGGEICLRDGSSVSSTCFLSFWSSLTDGPHHLCEGSFHQEIACISCTELPVDPQ